MVKSPETETVIEERPSGDKQSDEQVLDESKIFQAPKKVPVPPKKIKAAESKQIKSAPSDPNPELESLSKLEKKSTEKDVKSKE